MELSLWLADVDNMCMRWGLPKPWELSGQIIYYSNFFWREPVLNPQDFHVEPIWPGRAPAENHRKWFLNTRSLSRPAQSPKVAKVNFWLLNFVAHGKTALQPTKILTFDAWLGWLPPGVEKWRQKAVVSSGGRRLRSEHLQFSVFLVNTWMVMILGFCWGHRLIAL